MSYECNFLFEFLPCVLLILCFVSMIFLTHAGMISQHAPWQNSYALTIRCFHVASHINRGVTRIFSGVRTILQMPLSPNPLLNVPKGEIIVSRSVLTVYSCFEKGCRKKCARDRYRKVIWDMINTLFVTTEAVEPTFVAFL